MDIFWQQVTIGLVVAAAVAFLVVRYIRRRTRKASRCESCALLKQANRQR